MLRSCSDINKLLKNARFDWLKKTLEKAWAESRSRLPSPSLSHQLCLDIMFIEAHGRHRLEKHLLLNESLNLYPILTIIVIYVVGSLFKDVVHVFVVFFNDITYDLHNTNITIL